MRTSVTGLVSAVYTFVCKRRKISVVSFLLLLNDYSIVSAKVSTISCFY